MIPKKIHYCWFGGQPKHELAEHFIASWKRIHPDFEITEWNDSNWPALKAKKNRSAICGTVVAQLGLEPRTC